MNNFRAAYIPDDGSSTGGGILLTTEDQSGLSDSELLAAAESVADDIGAEGDIVIGDWRE